MAFSSIREMIAFEIQIRDILPLRHCRSSEKGFTVIFFGMVFGLQLFSIIVMILHVLKPMISCKTELYIVKVMCSILCSAQQNLLRSFTGLFNLQNTKLLI